MCEGPSVEPTRSSVFLSVFLVVFLFLIVGKTFLLGTAPNLYDATTSQGHAWALSSFSLGACARTLEWLCCRQTYQKTPRIKLSENARDLKLVTTSTIFPAWYQTSALARLDGAKATYTKNLIVFYNPMSPSRHREGPDPILRAFTLNIVQRSINYGGPP